MSVNCIIGRVKEMRNLFAILLGAIVGSVILFIVGFIANAISPTPPELMDPSTPEEVAQRVALTSTFSWITTIIGLGLGTFLGSFLGAKIASQNVLRVALSVGLILSLWAFYTLYVVYPAVLWVPIVMLIAVLLFSYLGGVIASSPKNNSSPRL